VPAISDVSRPQAKNAGSPDAASISAPKALARKLGRTLGLLRAATASRSIFTDFIRTLEPLNVRPAQYSVLVLVEANPGRSQAAIGKALNIERARLARLLHELERRKWIERCPATGDGRSHSLFLTGAGEKALLQINRLARRHEDHITKLVGADRRTALMKLLKDFG
jgi:DNA-binding MarR family transcriptional regulator